MFRFLHRMALRTATVVGLVVIVGKKITVTYKDGSTVVYHVLAADVSGIVKKDGYWSFHGKKGSEAAAKDYEVTRPVDGDIALEDE